MSCGVVICSKCKREIHQDGWEGGDSHNRAVWIHCEDQTPRCENASTDYAVEPYEQTIVGRWCGVDRC